MVFATGPRSVLCLLITGRLPSAEGRSLTLALAVWIRVQVSWGLPRTLSHSATSQVTPGFGHTLPQLPERNFLSQELKQARFLPRAELWGYAF